MGMSQTSNSDTLSMTSMTVIILCMVGLGLGQGGQQRSEDAKVAKVAEEIISMCSDGGVDVTLDQVIDCSQTKMEKVKEKLQAIEINIPQDGSIRERFDMYDENKDGKVTVEEVKNKFMMINGK